MGNRTSRHQRPGQHDLRGKKTKSSCPCCDEIINHREKIIERLHQEEMDYPEENMGD